MPDMNLGLGLGSAATLDDGGGTPSPNPNLLKWSEQFQQAEWVASGAIVTADAGVDPDGGATADSVLLGGAGHSVAQISTATAASGSATAAVSAADGAWNRRTVTTVFDTGTYVFSVWLQGVGSALTVLLALDQSGGLIRCQIRRLAANGTILAWGAKLETPGLTAYVKREGV